MPLENSAFLLQPDPDAVYCYSRVDGRDICRVIGERGNAPVVGFATGSRILGTSDEPGKGFGNYDVDDLEMGADGRFQVISAPSGPRVLPAIG